MLEGFTDRACRVMVLVQDEARRLNQNYTGTEHLLLGLIHEGDGIVARTLETTGISLEAVYAQIIEIIGEGEQPTIGHIPLTPRTRKVLEYSMCEALQLGYNYIGIEHILLGLLCEGDGAASQVLANLRVDLNTACQTVIELLGGFQGENVPDNDRDVVGISGGRADNPRGGNSALLDQFGCNLTQAAQENKLDPVIGHIREMERAMQILSRRTKNNPVLVGEPGVGKAAVVEDLAQSIVRGDVPETLKDKQLYSLDMGSLVAGSRYHGDFEERLKKVLKEIRTCGDIILLIDEIHILVGTGTTEGAIDVASILKPILAREKLQTIGATTLEEYRKYIEKDSALERRFQPVRVEEPNAEETVVILKGLRDRYESHHRAMIINATVASAAQLADRCISNRFLSDKAIDLIDEAGVRLRT